MANRLYLPVLTAGLFLFASSIAWAGLEVHGPETTPGQSICEHSLNEGGGSKGAMNPGPQLFRFDRDLGHYVFPAFAVRPASLNSALTRALLAATGLSSLNSVTSDFLDDYSRDPYFVRLARAFDLRISETEPLRESLAKIPRTGPLVFVLNHPLNGSEGIAVAAELAKVRPDLKVMLTHFLGGFPDMNEAVFFVDPRRTKEAEKYNAKVIIRQVMPHLAQGKAMLIFPAGQVSELDRLTGDADEGKWAGGLAHLVNLVKATQIVPIYVEGRASDSFHSYRNFVRTWSRLGPLAEIYLQPLMHAREIANNRRRTLNVQVGYAIEGSSLIASFTREPGISGKRVEVDYEEIMGHLRALTLALKGRLAAGAGSAAAGSEGRRLEPIWAPEDPEAHSAQVVRELAAADPDAQRQAGVPAGGVRVHLIDGPSLGVNSALARELGRIREGVFRSVGEGSGKALDLDSFDQLYMHLLAFDPRSSRIVGAYRMGRLDELAGKGIRSYTNSEFEFSPELERRLATSGLELGRSFLDQREGLKRVAATGFFRIFQKIGSFVADHPNYRYLVGPVSISSAAYSEPSKRIMVRFLKTRFPCLGPEMSARPRPDYGYDPTITRSEMEVADSLKTLADLKRVVQAIDGKDIPPLLGIYDSFGAKYLAFAEDREFGTVDAMIVVDMHAMKDDPELRKRIEMYLGSEGLGRYLQANRLLGSQQE